MALFPQEFIDSTRASLGESAQVVLDALAGDETVAALRANPAKIAADSLRKRFPAAGENVPWCGEAFYLEERPAFSLDPLLHAGSYYVQDPSAMAVGSLAEGVIDSLEAPLNVLDLCAAPGGKSTALAAALRPSDLLVANEVIGSRASILAENLVKWGSVNTVVTNSDPKDFGKLNGCFDIIVTDVPCSGEGMFRKEPKSIAEWSPDNVNLCAARQRRIVADVWPALKTGGYLIYSTCTFNSQENDGNVEWICHELGAEVVLPTAAATSVGSIASPSAAPNAFCRLRKKTVGLQKHSSRQAEGGATNEADCVAENTALETKYGLQFAPGITRGEGQYVALLRKTSPEVSIHIRAPKLPKRAECGLLKGDMVAFQVATSAGTLIKGYPQQLAGEIRFFEENLKTIRSGVAVAQVKGRDLIPQADLALSVAFRQDVFPAVELSKEDALNFLRTQPLHLPDAPNGFLTVKYDGLPIGFVKNLGSRANNLFPQAWRLRM